MSFLRLLVSQHRAAQVRALSPNTFRRYSILQEFSKKFKGEIESNPELKKSIKDFQDKAETLKTRTKETAEHLYKHVDAARGEAETRAKQVSSVIKEKISEASDQVRETVATVKNSEKKTSETLKQEPRVEDVPKHDGKANATSETPHGTEQRAETKQSDQPSSSGETFGGKLFKTLRVGRIADVAKEGYNILAEELTSTRRVKPKKPSIPRSKATDIAAFTKDTSGWRGRLDELKDKAASHPLFRRLQGVKDHPVVQKSHEIVEEVRERIETSDSPVVHRIQDLNEIIFGETAIAAAKKEIRMRDPSFSLPDFVAEVQESIKPILAAYYKGDFVALRKLCSKQVVERSRAEQRALRSQNLFKEHKILYISDIEVRESKLLGNEPVITITFHTQESCCWRDELGEIKEGSMDTIKTVYYYWAMQYVPEEEMGPEEYTPRWQLREMQQLGVQAII